MNGKYHVSTWHNIANLWLILNSLLLNKCIQNKSIQLKSNWFHWL